ncbi:hypothetical protein D3C81_1258940 [compost metagenome]
MRHKLAALYTVDDDLIHAQIRHVGEFPVTVQDNGVRMGCFLTVFTLSLTHMFDPGSELLNRPVPIQIIAAYLCAHIIDGE